MATKQNTIEKENGKPANSNANTISSAAMALPAVPVITQRSTDPGTDQPLQKEKELISSNGFLTQLTAIPPRQLKIKMKDSGLAYRTDLSEQKLRDEVEATILRRNLLEVEADFTKLENSIENRERDQKTYHPMSSSYNTHQHRIDVEKDLLVDLKEIRKELRKEAKEALKLNPVKKKNKKDTSVKPKKSTNMFELLAEHESSQVKSSRKKKEKVERFEPVFDDMIEEDVDDLPLEELTNTEPDLEKLVEDKSETTTKESSGGFCFLTTACTARRGLADDCVELTTLRYFRDHYLVHRKNGNKLVQLYYAIAPGIVDQINRSGNATGIYNDIYTLITHCVRRIREEEYEKAFQLYVKLVAALQSSLEKGHHTINKLIKQEMLYAS